MVFSVWGFLGWISKYVLVESTVVCSRVGSG